MVCSCTKMHLWKKTKTWKYTFYTLTIPKVSLIFFAPGSHKNEAWWFESIQWSISNAIKALALLSMEGQNDAIVNVKKSSG